MDLERLTTAAVCLLLAAPAVAQPERAPAAPPAAEPQPPADTPTKPAPGPADAPDATASAPGPGPAPSQEAPGGTTADTKSAAVHLLLFVGATPAEGVTVTVPGSEPGTSSGDGSVTLTLSKGGPQALRLSVPRTLLPDAPGDGPVSVELPPVELVPGETVEIIATLAADGSVESMDVEGADTVAAERAEREAFEKAQAEKPKGTVHGTVVASEGKGAVAGARVFVRGADVEAETNDQGEFTLELPEGTYALSVIHPDFSTESKDGVAVQGQKTTDVKLELTPASVTLDDFVITAPHVEGGVASLIAERRESSAVTDVIGAQEMSRTGASDAAGALKRVTGINVVGGKYVYVRGMGERYSATLLNGQLIPSPDPERRVIPLDIFPIQVLESVVIQKTFSPDMPAEFGGGMVQLRTRSYPERLTVQVSAQVGANTRTTFQDGPTYRGGSTDWLGIDDGSRELPKAIAETDNIKPSNRFTPDEGYTKEERAAFARALPNDWNVYREKTPVNKKFTVTVGDKFQLGPVPFGVLASGVYSDKFRHRVGRTARYTASDASEGGLQVANQFRTESLTRTISSGGVLAAGSDYLPGQSIKSTTLLLRVTDSSVNLVEGLDDNVGQNVHRARLQWVERQLLSEQISGTQKIAPLGDAQLDWAYAFATATLKDPNRRQYQYLQPTSSTDPQDYTFDTGTMSRVDTKMDDKVHTVNLDYTQPFPIWAKLEAKGKVGGLFLNRTRTMDRRRFTLDNQPGLVTGDVLHQSPENIYDPSHIDADNGLLLGPELTAATDAYTAEQVLQAGYGMVDVPVVKPLEVMAGVRVERSKQTVKTFAPFSTEDEPIFAKLDNTDILPGSTVTWRFTDEMSVRGGYGRTVSRPDFRELSQARYIDVTGNKYDGNPDLKRATIDNYDARWEWYFSTDELVSAGAFYKSFDHPIEVTAIGGSEFGFSWQNADSAVNYGLEFEGRRRLEWIDDHLEDFFISSNVALIKSAVDLSSTTGTATSKNRPLQGQAPYVVNAQFGFDDTTADDGIGLTTTLLYNVTGPAIWRVGVFGAPDIKQQPVHTIDLTLAQELPAGFRLTFKAQNLLDPEVRMTQGDKTFQSYHIGRTFSLGLAWNL